MAEVVRELESLPLIPCESRWPSTFAIGKLPTPYPRVVVWGEVFTLELENLRDSVVRLVRQTRTDEDS